MNYFHLQKRNLNKLLGISAYFHDSAASIVVDGKIIAAAQEERFNRDKNSAVFPSQAIRYCLKEAGITLHDVDDIVFFEKPFLKFERLLETYYNNAPKGLLSFLKAMPQWTQKKLALRREVRRELRKIDTSYKDQKKLLFASHHLSHAASAFYPSPFNDASILVVDAVGEWATATIGKGEGTKIELLREMRFPDSVGLLYSAFTYFLGFKVNSGEYKLMGLSPYGDGKSNETKRFIELIRKELVEIHEDGSIQMNRAYFTFEHSLRMVSDSKWAKLFGIAKREPEEAIIQTHCNLAFAIQSVTEEIVLKMARTAKAITQSENLCLAGGVALNCVANGKIQESGLFKKVWIQPAAGDAGGAIGAALAHYFFRYAENRAVNTERDEMSQALLGPSISEEELEAFCEENHLKPLWFKTNAERNQFTVANIIDGKVIGWVQGRMEYSPRALGARSIIASPSITGMQRKLNMSVKFREDFRPFAPVMLREEALNYFNCDYEAAYMQFVKKIATEHRYPLVKNFNSLSLKEKLEVPRSKFQAITHVDFSSRLQVVEERDHPFYGLLLEMRRQSGDAVLVNTSFNTNGEPIVCDLKDAYNCFLKTNIDILVVGNNAFIKSK